MRELPKIISVDDHVIEHANVWQDRLPAKYRDVVSIAAVNEPKQVVISGRSDAVEAVVGRFHTQGVRTKDLVVSHAFHSPLMEPAATGLSAWLKDAPMTDPSIPVVSSVTAGSIGTAAEARRLLVAQVASPIRWEDTIVALDAFSPDVSLEMGPGGVLTGLLKRIRPTIRAISVETPAGIEAAREVLG